MDMDIPEEDEKKPERSDTDVRSGVVREDTFVVNNETPGQDLTSVSQDLRHRKAIALAKANARHVIKSWQKHHHLADNSVRWGSGSSRPYIQHISEAIQNDKGEKIYFRWQESGKMNNGRQPKAVSKLYAHKRKRIAKKVGLSSLASKSAPYRAIQDSSSTKPNDSKDHRIKTAETGQLPDNKEDVHFDKNGTDIPQQADTMYKNQTRKGKRVEFDLAPHRYRGVKEAFLSNSAKTQNGHTSIVGGVNSMTAISHQVNSLKTQDSDKTTSEGQTDSDKENAIAFYPQKEHSVEITRLTQEIEEKTKYAENKIHAQEQNQTSSKCRMKSSVTSTGPHPLDVTPTEHNQNDKALSLKESKPPMLPPTSKLNSYSQNYKRKEDCAKQNSLNIDHQDNHNPKQIQESLHNNKKGVTAKIDTMPNECKSASKYYENSEKTETSLTAPYIRKQRLRTENKKGNSVHKELGSNTLNKKNSTSVVQPKDGQQKQSRPSSVKAQSNQNKEKISNKTPKDHNTKKNLYRKLDPENGGDVITSSIKTSSHLSKSNYDKSDYAVKRDFEIERGHLNTIVESLSEQNTPIDRLKHYSSTGLLPVSNGAPEIDIKANSRLIFNKSKGVSANQPEVRQDRTTEKVKPISCRRQTSTNLDYSTDVQLDNRLSVSWPKTHSKSSISGTGEKVSLSDEKNSTPHRLDLLVVGNHSDEADSPPLSINRYYHRENERRGHASVQKGDSIGQIRNSSLSRKKVSIDNSLDHTDKQRRVTSKVEAKPDHSSKNRFTDSIERKGEQHPRDGVIRSNERIPLSGECENGFQIDDKRYNQMGSEKMTQPLEQQAALDLLQQSKETRQTKNKNGITIISKEEEENSKLVKFHLNDGGFTGSAYQVDNIDVSDFHRDSELDKLKQNCIQSQSGNDFMGKHVEGGSFQSISPNMDRNGNCIPVKEIDIACTLQASMLSKTTSERPVSAGMSLYLDRPSFWIDDNDSTRDDDDIKFINDEKDFYDVFGYDAETTEILRATRIYPVADYSNSNSSGESQTVSIHSAILDNTSNKISKPGGVVSSNFDKKPKDLGWQEQKKLKIQSKAVLGGNNSVAAVNGKVLASQDEIQLGKSKSSSDVVIQEEMKLKNREKMLSLAMRTESDDSLYRNVPTIREGTKQLAKKAVQSEAVLMSTSSSSPSSSLTSQTSPPGIFRRKKGDTLQQKAFPSANGQDYGFLSEKEKSNRRVKKKSMDGIKVDVQPLPSNDLHLERAPRPPPSYQAELPVASEHNLQQNSNANPQIRPLLPAQKQVTSKKGYLQRRKFFSESETDQKNLDHLSTPLKLVPAHEPISMASLHERASKPLAKDNSINGQHALYSKMDSSQALPQYQIHALSQGQHGYNMDIGPQFKKYISDDVTRMTNTHTLPLNYTETADKVKSRLLEQTNHKLSPVYCSNNNIGLTKITASATTINNNNNNSNNYKKKIDLHHINGSYNKNVQKSQPQALAPCSEGGERPTKPLSNQPVRDNEDKLPVAHAQLQDPVSLSKPRKLKPIIHHPGMQKQHQHLASGL